MHPKLIQRYTQARQLHSALVADLVEIDTYIKSCPDPTELADVSYALREIGEFCEDVKKRVHMVRRMSDRLACQLTIGLTDTVDGTVEPIRTEFCTASQEPDTLVSIPQRKKDPEGYEKLLRYLEIPEIMWKDKEHHVIDLHWPGVVQLISERQRAGLPLPPGIDPQKTSVEYKLKIRGKKAPDADVPREPMVSQPFDSEIPF